MINGTFLINLFITFICFIVPAVIYNFAAERNNFLFKQTPFMPICLTVATASLLSYFFLYDERQFLTLMSAVELVAPFIVAMLIYFIIQNEKFHKLTYLIVAGGALVCAFAVPQEITVAISPLPPICNQLLIAATWTAFCWLFTYSNTCEAMSALQAFTICIGVAVLGFINAIPQFLGILSAYFAAAYFALLIFNWYPARIQLSKNDIICLGFLLFAPISWTIYENAASCVIIFSMYLLADFAYAVMLLLTFAPQYRNLLNNTSCRQALQKGLSPSMAASFSCRIQLLLIFFGVFQTLSVHQYSLLTVSTIITVWFLYRFHNLDQQQQSIAEINRKVLEDLQDRVNDIKQYIHGDDEQ